MSTEGNAKATNGDRQKIPRTISKVYGGERDTYNALSAKVLGILQVFSGLCALILQIALTFLPSWGRAWGGGYYAGIAFIIAGAVGYTAGKQKTIHWIFRTLVCNVVAIILAMCLLFVTACAVINDEQRLRTDPSKPFADMAPYIDCFYKLILVYGMMFLVGLMALVTHVWSAVLCCNVTCISQPEETESERSLLAVTSDEAMRKKQDAEAKRTVWANREPDTEQPNEKPNEAPAPNSNDVYPECTTLPSKTNDQPSTGQPQQQGKNEDQSQKQKEAKDSPKTSGETKDPSQKPDENKDSGQRSVEIKEPSQKPLEAKDPSQKPDKPKDLSQKPDKPKDPSQKPEEGKEPSQKPDESNIPPQKPDKAEKPFQQPAEIQMPSQKSNEVQQPPQNGGEIQIPSQKSNEVQQPPQNGGEIQIPSQKPNEIQQLSQKSTEVQQPPQNFNENKGQPHAYGSLIQNLRDLIEPVKNHGDAKGSSSSLVDTASFREWQKKAPIKMSRSEMARQFAETAVLKAQQESEAIDRKKEKEKGTSKEEGKGTSKEKGKVTNKI